MLFVTTLFVLMTTGAGELVIQTGAARFVVVCKVKGVPFVGHVKTTLVPERLMASCGVLTTGTSERLKTVPSPTLPPPPVVPYRILPDKIILLPGLAPSVPPKVCRIVKPVPLVLMANTVPSSELPPYCAVPYRVLPDKINSAFGYPPSLPPVKLYKFVNPVPSVLTANTVP